MIKILQCLKFCMIVFVVFSVTACVSSRRYIELEKEYDEVLHERNRLQAEREELDRRREQLAVSRDDLELSRDQLVDELLNDRERFAAYQREQDEEIRKLESELANARREVNVTQLERSAMEEELQMLRERQALVEEQIQTYRDLVSRFRDMIDRGDLDVQFRNGRMYLVLSSDVLFPSGVAELSTQGRRTIRETGEKLADIDRLFQVEGHTDNRQIRGGIRFRDNWELGAGRAISVVKELIEAGVPEIRLSGASFSDTQPVQSNSTAEGRSANRRIEIVVVPELMPLAELEDLNS